MTSRATLRWRRHRLPGGAAPASWCKATPLHRPSRANGAKGEMTLLWAQPFDLTIRNLRCIVPTAFEFCDLRLNRCVDLAGRHCRAVTPGRNRSDLAGHGTDRDHAEGQGEMLESDSLQCDDSSLVLGTIHGPPCPWVVGECVPQDLGRSIKIARIRKPSDDLHTIHDAIASPDEPVRYPRRTRPGDGDHRRGRGVTARPTLDVIGTTWACQTPTPSTSSDDHHTGPAFVEFDPVHPVPRYHGAERSMTPDPGIDSLDRWRRTRQAGRRSGRPSHPWEGS